MTEAELDIRRRAAARAKQVLEGSVSPDAFREEFADIEDRRIAALLDLMEHQPEHGLLGGGESAWRDYQKSVRDVIAGLVV